MASWKQSRVFGRAAKLEACSKSSEFSRLAAWAGLTHPKLDMGLACLSDVRQSSEAVAMVEASGTSLVWSQFYQDA